MSPELIVLKKFFGDFDIDGKIKARKFRLFELLSDPLATQQLLQLGKNRNIQTSLRTDENFQLSQIQHHRIIEEFGIEGKETVDNLNDWISKLSNFWIVSQSNDCVCE